MASTLEEIKKAYEDLSDEDKKAFEQSIADRVHESLGEQEAEKGDKDEQTAADREHEAEGAEHADGEGDVEELHETEPEETAEEVHEEAHENVQEEKHEEAEARNDNQDDRLSRIEQELADIKAMFAEQNKQKTVEQSAKDIYGLGNGVFVAEPEAKPEKKMTGAEVGAILNKVRR